MRLKGTLRTLMASAGTALLAASCSVDVDLCTDPFHPHSAEVSYGFSFADGTAAPDSMTVSSATGRGYFVQGAIEGINEPEEPAPGDSSGGDTPPEDIEISTEGGGEGQPGGSDASVGGAASSRQAGLPDSSPGDDLDGEGDPSGGADAGGDASAEEPADQSLASFRLPVGDYRFMAFNMDTTELIYDDVMAYLAGDGAMGMGELCVDYRTYSKGDPELRKALPAWHCGRIAGARAAARLPFRTRDHVAERGYLFHHNQESRCRAFRRRLRDGRNIGPACAHQPCPWRP